MNIRTRLHVALGALALTACSGSSTPSTVPTPTADVGSTTLVGNAEVTKYFPLLNGHIYSYRTETDQGAGMMVTRVTRADGASGDLQGPQGTKSFRYMPDGVVLDGGGTMSIYVLKLPFEVGNTWRGQGGSSVEIVEVGARVDVPAGSYQDCIKTVEKRGGDRPLQIATTYCPDTGIVLLEAASGMAMERVALQSYGPPVDLGPDGVRAIPPDDSSGGEDGPAAP